VVLTNSIWLITRGEGGEKERDLNKNIYT